MKKMYKKRAFIIEEGFIIEGYTNKKTFYYSNKKIKYKKKDINKIVFYIDESIDYEKTYEDYYNFLYEKYRDLQDDIRNEERLTGINCDYESDNAFDTYMPILEYIKYCIKSNKLLIFSDYENKSIELLLNRKKYELI